MCGDDVAHHEHAVGSDEAADGENHCLSFFFEKMISEEKE